MLLNKVVIFLVAFCCFLAASAQQANTGTNQQGPQTSTAANQQTSTGAIPAGTEIKVRADQQITADTKNVGQSYPGTVTQAVVDSSGNILIPKGARAQLKTIASGSKVAVDLASVTVNGKKYNIEANPYKTGSVGANKTTAKYAGGGALAGLLIGAIAGGGKGAAIGTLAGGAAGAGAQVLTAGKSINIPAETVLTFKTAQELQLNPVASGAQ
jgi:hypothetical protein